MCVSVWSVTGRGVSLRSWQMSLPAGLPSSSLWELWSPRWKQEQSQLSHERCPLPHSNRASWGSAPCQLQGGPLPPPLALFLLLLLCLWVTVIYLILATGETGFSRMRLNLSVWSHLHRVSTAAPVCEWEGVKRGESFGRARRACVCGVRGGQEARLVTCHHMSTPKSTLPPFHTNHTCMSKWLPFYVKMTGFLLMCGNASGKTEVCLAFLSTVYICRWLVSACL